jgi:cell division protein FtsW (lipid II flippase)
MSALADLLPARPRRSASLALLVFAIVVSIAAFAQVGLARDGRLPAGMVGYGAGLTALSTIAYFVVARFTPYADPLLLPLAVFLNGIGLAMIYRLDLSTSRDVEIARARGEDVRGVWASTPNQLMWTFVAIALFVVAIIVLRDVKAMQKYIYTLGALGLFLLALPGFLPSSISGALGAKIWIRIGPISFQPGEFAKILLVIFFAGYLVNKRDALAQVGRRVGFIHVPRARDMLPIVIIWLICLGVLVLEKDLGSALLFFGLFVSMLYIATQRVSWVFIGVGLLLVGGFLASLLPFLGHVRQRIDTWLNPEPYFDGGCAVGGEVLKLDPAQCAARGGDYADSGQLLRGLFSFGEGSIVGRGLGQGEPWRTPLSFNDFIIASFGEELGLAGLMVILLVYALIVERGFKTAVVAREPFLKLFAGGISFVLALQVFVIVGGVTRLIPLTGLTTPFLSQGGSSLLANWILVAVLIRISDLGRRPAPQSIQDEGLTQVVRV